MKNAPSKPAVSGGPSRKRADLLVCAALVLAVLAVYWPVRGFDFLNYDDNVIFSGNPFVRLGLTWRGLAWAWGPGTFYYEYWHPLMWWSDMLDCALFGLRPGWHHLVNVLFHAANTLLLFALLRRVTGLFWRRAVVAALFALHPLHVESVAWLAERKDLLAAFFWLLSIGAYVEYARQTKSSKLSYALALVCFALGLMSKPMVVTLPFVLLLLDFWPLGRFTGPRVPAGLIREKWPFFVLMLLSCGITFLTVKSGNHVLSAGDIPWSLRLANVPVAYARYLGKLVWPANLAVLYPLPKQWPVWQVLGATLIIVLLTWLVLARARRAGYLVFGWFLFLGTLVPVIGLVSVGSQAMADRYMYLPSIGLLIAGVWAVADATHRWRNRTALLGGSVAVSLLALGVTTRTQVFFWKDSVALFAHAAAATRDNAVAECNLGEALATRRQWDEAMSRLDVALRLRPDMPEALDNEGRVLDEQGKTEDAAARFGRAIAARPAWNAPHRNFGLLLLKHGKLEDAIAQFRIAVQLEGHDDSAFAHLGLALLQQGKLDDAIAACRSALAIAPNALAENVIGGALDTQGHADEAARHYLAATRIEPDFAEPRNNLGAFLNARDKFAEARDQLVEALKLKPDFADAHFNLGNSLLALGNLKDAAAEFSAVVRLQPADVEAHFQLARILAQEGDLPGAAAQYAEALRLRPEFPEAHAGLAAILARQGNDGPAIAEYNAALQLTPQNPAWMRKLAWLLATTTEHALGNAREALRLSRLADDLAAPATAEDWDTRGAVCAEAGQFPEAITAATKALGLANSAGQKDLAAQIQLRLQLYQAGKPFHETPRATTGQNP